MLIPSIIRREFRALICIRGLHHPFQLLRRRSGALRYLHLELRYCLFFAPVQAHNMTQGQILVSESGIDGALNQGRNFGREGGR